MFGKRKIGIALSGGSARGLSHIGVLKVLDELGVNIDAVSGCSMGAIVGAIYSLGIDFREVEDYLKKTDWRNFLLFSGLALARSGIINDRKVDEALSKFFGKKTFDDCKKEFCCVAVDISNGKKVIFRSGSLKEAVRASISLPGIFPPVCINDTILVDGGIVEPLPTEAIRVLDVNFIIASSIVFKSDNPVNTITDMMINELKSSVMNTKRLSIQTIIDKSMNLIHEQIVKSYLLKANILIEPKIGDYGFFDFIKSKQIIEAGRKAAVEKIPEIKKKLRIR